MRRVRLFLAWIMMVAVPLQGFAAATMLLCGQAPGHGAAASAHAHEARPAHGHGHGEQAASHQDAGHEADSQGGMLHKCGVCASCSHAVAITESLHTPGVAIPPQQRIAEPLVVVVFRPVPLPDKPPRA
jgi:hypothetical protein